MDRGRQTGLFATSHINALNPQTSCFAVLQIAVKGNYMLICNNKSSLLQELILLWEIIVFISRIIRSVEMYCVDEMRSFERQVAAVTN